MSLPRVRHVMSALSVLTLLAPALLFASILPVDPPISGSEACNNSNLRLVDRAVLKCNDYPEAVTYLKSIRREGLSRCAPPENDKNIEGLNQTFAICAAQFLRAYQERYGQIIIRSALRSGENGSAEDGSGRTANQCAGGAPSSNHMRGVAMDVNPANDSMYPTLWKFASDNPQFGVCFPHQLGGANTTGYSDRPHMILAGIGGSEGGACARQGVTRPCSGLPTNITNTPIQPGAPAATGGLANTLRQAFGLPTQQAQPVIAQPASPSQPVSVSQSPLSSFGSTETTGASSQISDGTEPTSPSSTAADRLEGLAFGQPATSTQSATSVPLVVSGADAATLSGSQNASTTAVSTNGTIAPSQTTFVSDDLSWQGGETVSSAPVSGMTAILITIKATLQRLLLYLQPFGSHTVNEYGELHD
jgi:hypothetical protein